MTECLYCKGNLVSQSVSRTLEFHGKWYLLENVPALVCAQCGEIYYTPQSHDQVLALIKSGKKPTRTETLTVLDIKAA